MYNGYLSTASSIIAGILVSAQSELLDRLSQFFRLLVKRARR